MNEPLLIPRVGVGTIIRRGDEVLLLRRHKTHGAGTWSTPGGYLEFGESPEQCAARETLEETGVAIADASFLTITNDFFPQERKHFITLWMHANHHSGAERLAAPDEATEVEWFHHQALPQPLFVCFANLLKSSAYFSGHWLIR